MENQTEKMAFTYRETAEAAGISVPHGHEVGPHRKAGMHQDWALRSNSTPRRFAVVRSTAMKALAQLDCGAKNFSDALLTAALAYAERGWLVFPLHSIRNDGGCTCGKSDCASPGKHPRTKHGLKDATTDVQQIHHWWALWPDANIGIATGAVSGLVAIDLDGDIGRENFQRLLQPHRFQLENTLMSHTGGDGCHLPFQHSGVPIENSTGKLGVGIDVRGEGGYIVAPPSMHVSGNRYRWSDLDVPPAKLPEWLLQMLVAPPQLKVTPTNGSGVIPDGQRNSTLASLAGTMRRKGMGEQSIIAALQEDNSARCQPPLAETEVAAIAASICRYEPADAPDAKFRSEKTSQTDRLIQVGSDAELFHTPEGEAYATVEVGGHRETWRIAEAGFRQWLTHRYFEATGKGPNSQSLRDAISVFQCRARFAGPEHPVFIRIAGFGEAIYLDLANLNWEIVEITSFGWSIITDAPVKFRRPRGMMPLPRPVAGGSITSLRRFVNVESETDWMLIVAWLVAAFRPRGPYPLLALHGEHGTAKSSTAKAIRRLIDPNSAELRAEPRESRDLVIAASNSWVVALDNSSYIPAWLSDALCRLATGGGFGTRQLYTDDEERIFQAQRPVVLNGIDEIVTRPDLLDRALILYLPCIRDEDRRPEDDVWREYELEHPGILGAILDAVAAAIKNVNTVQLPRLPRMADFALWVTAAADGLGWAPHAFVDEYTSNRANANSLALEGSPLTAPIRELAAECSWEGTATDLLDELSKRAGTAAGPKSGWPKNGKALSSQLRRLAPNLRAEGIQLDFGKSGKRFVKVGKIASSASSASAD